MTHLVEEMGQRQALQAKRRAGRDSEGKGEARSEGQGPGKSSNVMDGASGTTGRR